MFDRGRHTYLCIKEEYGSVLAIVVDSPLRLASLSLEEFAGLKGCAYHPYDIALRFLRLADTLGTGRHDSEIRSLLHNVLRNQNMSLEAAIVALTEEVKALRAQNTTYGSVTQKLVKTEAETPTTTTTTTEPAKPRGRPRKEAAEPAKPASEPSYGDLQAKFKEYDATKGRKAFIAFLQEIGYPKGLSTIPPDAYAQVFAQVCEALDPSPVAEDDGSLFGGD